MLVSKNAFEQVCNERNWLRAELEKTRDHLRRMERIDNGLSEVPVERKKPEVLPSTLRVLIGGFSSSVTRMQYEQRCIKERAAGREWKDIEMDVFAEIHGGT